MVRRWIVLAVVCVMLISSAVALNMNPAEPLGLPQGLFSEGPDEPAVDAAAVPGTAKESKLQLALSETGHFFEGSIKVAIIASVKDAEIYYTTDGSEPTSASREYSGALNFLAPVSRDINVITLKAIAVYGDTVTRPLTHTYFLGKDVGKRFDTLVFSLSTDTEHLYDYDTGIFVEGRTRDDYVKKNPRKKIDPPAPANFNWRGMEGERPIYVEVFEPDGRRVAAQAAGIRVSGGWSRAANQKSIRLIARREYEPDFGKFQFDFFPGDVAAGGYGSPIPTYDQIVLRNGANDRNEAMLRNEVANELIHEAGIRDVSPNRAAAVFINGEYYGFVWLQVKINEQYLEDVYNAPTRDFQIIGDGEQWVRDGTEADKEAIDHLNSYSYKDLRSEKTFAELEALVDIDNALRYYAFQMYMGNWDWPGNNLKRWRYTGPQIDGLAPELDGRWRFIAYDLDWTLGLYGADFNKDDFREVLGGNRNSPFLSALLKRKDMADKFTMIVCDLAANIITEERVREKVARLSGEAANEINAAMRARRYDWWVSYDSISEKQNAMYSFARGRFGYFTKRLRDYFDFGFDMFDVEVTGGEAVIGTQKGTSSRYFAHLTVPLRPVLPKFTVFDHWVLGGKKIYEPEISVSLADARDGVVKVELVTKEDMPALAFAEAYGSSARNGCVLYNPAGETVRAAGLYLSNDPQNPFLWALPDATVKPGGTLGLAGKGSGDPADLLLIRMGFTVRQGRMLYLSDSAGALLDVIIVP